MFIDLPQRKQSCAIYHMETALSFHMVDNDMQEPQTKLRLVCVMSSFHERPCHLAAVILFYYHGLACEQFEIIPNKLALIKIYSNKRCGET